MQMDTQGVWRERGNQNKYRHQGVMLTIVDTTSHTHVYLVFVFFFF